MLSTREARLPALLFTTLFGVACGDGAAGPIPPELGPGTEWGGGDWPSLISPALDEDVIIGDPVPKVTVPYDGDFKPLLNAVQGQDWLIRITRPETLCDTQVDKYPTGSHWSYELPVYNYFFDPCVGYYDSELKNYDASWQLTDNHRFKLMQNGQWLGRHQVPHHHFTSDNHYDVDRWFTLPAQPDLYMSMVHAWVVGAGADSDRIFVEGAVTIEHRVQSGVEITDTKTFTETTGWSAGIDIKGISASLSQTFEKQSSHTVSLETQTETIETKVYEVPANERWRFIQLYGVDRYLFTDANGDRWDSETLRIRSLGNVDNKTRNVLMIVKYRGGSNALYATEVLEVLDNGRIVRR
jgi:hypothetical protein